MTTFAQPSPSPVLRALAATLRRGAAHMERPASRCLPLEPLAPVDCADERIRERRHQVFTRYY